MDQDFFKNRVEATQKLRGYLNLSKQARKDGKWASAADWVKEAAVLFFNTDYLCSGHGGKDWKILADAISEEMQNVGVGLEKICRKGTFYEKD